MQAAALSPDPGLQPAGLAAGRSEGNLEGLLWKREQRDREGHQTGEAGSVPVGRGPHSPGVWQGTESSEVTPTGRAHRGPEWLSGH